MTEKRNFQVFGHITKLTQQIIPTSSLTDFHQLRQAASLLRKHKHSPLTFFFSDILQCISQPPDIQTFILHSADAGTFLLFSHSAKCPQKLIGIQTADSTSDHLAYIPYRIDGLQIPQNAQPTKTMTDSTALYFPLKPCARYNMQQRTERGHLYPKFITQNTSTEE